MYPIPTALPSTLLTSLGGGIWSQAEANIGAPLPTLPCDRPAASLTHSRQTSRQAMTRGFAAAARTESATVSHVKV